MNKYLVALLLILCVTQYKTIKKIGVLKSECNRLETNQSYYIDSLTRYKTNEGLNVASINILQLKCNELKTILSERANIINQLKLKLKRIEQFESTVHQTTLNAKTVIRRDTIIHKDTVWNFFWQNHWNQICGTIVGDSIICNLSVRDTLHQIVHRVPRRFLFIRFGTKYLKQEIISSNPNSRIVWNEHIKIVKSKQQNLYCL